MARYDRQYDFGLRGYDHGFRPLPPSGMGGYDTAPGRDDGAGRGYDAGFRGTARGAHGGYDAFFRARPRPDADPRPRGGAYDRGFRGDAGDMRAYDFGMRGGGWLPNRVTRRYNLDYVQRPPRAERPFNYAPYGGDVDGRMGDAGEYARPYITTGGTRTGRGGGRPVGWEHLHARGQGRNGWGGGW